MPAVSKYSVGRRPDGGVYGCESGLADGIAEHPQRRKKNLQLTNRACCRAGIHCSSCPEPLLIKDIKVQVNKQKPNSVRPAQMKHNSDKMPIAPLSSQPCSKPNVGRSPTKSRIMSNVLFLNLRGSISLC